MVVLTRVERLTGPSASARAAAGVALLAAAILLMPAAILDQIAGRGDLAATVATVQGAIDPLVRIVLGLVLGGVVLSWLGRSLRGGDRLHRHVDAPRPPLFATRDLGTPFLEVKAPATDSLDAMPDERPLPRDLDTPMAGFDPGALLTVPLPAAEPVAPLARPALIDPGDRFETFELTPARAAPPPAAAAPDRVVAPETEATIHDLLARLERGIAAGALAPVRTPPRAAAVPTGSLAGTLGDLRRLAAGAR